MNAESIWTLKSIRIWTYPLHRLSNLGQWRPISFKLTLYESQTYLDEEDHYNVNSPSMKAKSIWAKHDHFGLNLPSLKVESIWAKETILI